MIAGEEQIQTWVSHTTVENRVRVFIDCGDQDVLMLERARVMKSILDEAGLENQLQIGPGGHDYAYWVSSFESYLKCLVEAWGFPAPRSLNCEDYFPRSSSYFFRTFLMSSHISALGEPGSRIGLRSR